MMHLRSTVFLLLLSVFFLFLFPPNNVFGSKSQPPLLAERRQKPGFWVDIFDSPAAEHRLRGDEEEEEEPTTTTMVFGGEEEMEIPMITNGTINIRPIVVPPMLQQQTTTAMNLADSESSATEEEGQSFPSHHSPPPPSLQQQQQQTTPPPPPPSIGNEDEERLSIDIFKGYNALIRPAPCHNHSVVYVDFGMAMILLINVDEKNQIMQSNAWLTLKWNDCRFSWDPSDYGGLESMRVPVERVWVPDIVLFNNADGNYEVSFQSNVVVDYQGNVSWVPPAIYKSSCRIDVEYFPFDEQTCVLHFGSWTYGPDEVQLHWYGNKRSVELEDYSPSGIWDIMDVPGRMAPDRSRVEFHIVIRRKTLFYTVILIIPTVLMAFLSMLVFYLPAECSEKITLAISILLALVVFLLLVSKILPPTSDTIPLMAKYLLMTFVMNIITIMSTVCVLNVHFRSALTHEMPGWVQLLFLHLLPQLLCMRRPRRPSIFGVDDDDGAAADTNDGGSDEATIGKSKRKKLYGRSNSSRRSSTSSSAVVGRQCRPSLNAAIPGMAMAGMLPFVGGGDGHTRNSNNNNNNNNRNGMENAAGTTTTTIGGESISNKKSGRSACKLQQRRSEGHADGRGKGGGANKRKQQQNHSLAQQQQHKQKNVLPRPRSPGSPLPQLRRSQTSFIDAAAMDDESNNDDDNVSAAEDGCGNPMELSEREFGIGDRHHESKQPEWKQQQQQLPTSNASRVCARLGQLVEEQRMGQRLRQAVESIAFIAEHIRADMSDKKVRDDWRFISTVIDRLLLLIFFGITMGGLIAIIASVPHVFELVDQQQVIRRLIAQSKLEAAMAMDAAAAAAGTQGA